MAWVAVAAGLFHEPLRRLVPFCLHSDIYSYIPLIPLITLYLFYLDRAKPPAPRGAGWPLALVLVVVAGAAGRLACSYAPVSEGPGEQDRLALSMLAFVVTLLGGASACFGRAAFRRHLTALLLLLFAIPWPVALENLLNTSLQRWSADVSHLLFRAAGTPVYREGPILYLPSLTIEVAESCSGIRSTLVLLITSILAGHLFLRSRWRRALVVACVLPISVLRNSLRILSIGLLTMHWDPAIINGPLHKRGGPLFFVASLAVLLAITMGLRLGDGVLRRAEAEDE